MKLRQIISLTLLVLLSACYQGQLQDGTVTTTFVFNNMSSQAVTIEMQEYAETEPVEVETVAGGEKDFFFTLFGTCIAPYLYRVIATPVEGGEPVFIADEAADYRKEVRGESCTWVLDFE